MMDNEPSDSTNPGPKKYENVTFRTDLSGNRIAIRPNQFLASPLSEPGTFRRRVAEALAATVGPNHPDFGELVTEILALSEIEDKNEDLLQQYNDLLGDIWNRLIETEPTAVGSHRLFTVTSDLDIVRLVRELERRAVPAQPNHLYSITSLGFSQADKSFSPNLVAGFGFNPNLVAGFGFNPNLVAGFGFNPNLVAALAGHSGGCCCPNGLSTDDETLPVAELGARPAPPRREHEFHDPVPPANSGANVEIHIIDVMATLVDLGEHKTGEVAKETPPNNADVNEDGWIDPATGHGDFVKSVVQLHSGIEATLWHAATSLGVISDDCLHKALVDVAAAAPDPETRKVLNLSLGGYNIDDRPGQVLADQIADMIKNNWLIVASAGNNGSCRLTWPAALPDVVAVGAVDSCGPAWFSNFGPWVDASALGVNVVARYPKLADLGDGDSGTILSDARVTDGDEASDEVADQPLRASDFSSEWASWSGTSFSAPLVAAKLALELQKIAMTEEPAPRQETTSEARIRAIDTVIRNKEADYLPGYGTIVKGGPLWPPSA